MTPDEKSPSPSTASPAADPSPDWDAQVEDIHCPLCEYNLRGLIEPRCPECGYRFAWKELQDPARRRHPFLFEHADERKFRAFRKTLWATWRPRRFWKELHPAQTLSIRRMIVYWLFCFVPLMAGMILASCDEFLQEYQRTKSQRVRLRASIANQPNLSKVLRDSKVATLDQYMDRYLPINVGTIFRNSVLSRRFTNVIVAVCVIPVSWCWLTIASFHIFRWSLKRAKLRFGHLWRCATYSFDVIFWYGCLFILCAPISFCLASTNNWFPTLGRDLFVGYDAIVLLWMLFLALGLYRITCALKLYLQWHRPFGTVIAMQVIVALIALKLFFFIEHNRLLRF